MCHFYFYTHITNANQFSDDVDYSLLSEPEAEELAVLIAKYHNVLRLAAREHEPCTLIQYLFDLSHAVASSYHFLVLILIILY